MMETEKSELFEALAELSRRYPQWRTGQLLANIAGWTNAQIWEVEDGQLLAAARQHLEQIGSRKPAPLTAGS